MNGGRDEATPLTMWEGSQPSVLTELPKQRIFYRPASLQERFSAFFTDSFIFFYLLGVWVFVLKYLTTGNWRDPLSVQGTGRMLLGTTALALHFLYFFFFEGVLTATPGKLLGGLSVRKKSGGTPSLIAIVIRNLLRLIDYPFFFITGVGLMEATKNHQRLGDLLSGTIVVRRVAFEVRRINPEEAQLGGATRRSLAFIFDLLLIVPFFYGFLLMIPTNRALVSLVALNSAPTLTLFYISVSESLFQTTFGKALFGLKVVQEDGRPATFSTALLRNAFRLFDMNPGGYLCAALSSRKQRPGDIAAGTIVVKSREGWRGWLVIPFMATFAVAVAYIGYRNPDSFLKKGTRLEIAGHAFHPIPISLQRLTYRRLFVEEVNFGFNQEELNKKAIYEPGDTVYVLFRISGFAVINDRSWIQADLKVRDSRANIILDRLNVVNSTLTSGSRKPLKFSTRFVLHPDSLPGRYEATLIVRDSLGNTKVERKEYFAVRAKNPL